MILIELLIFLSTLFPIFHLINALLTRRKTGLAKQEINEEKISILVPCFNEEDTVRVSIKGLLDLNYCNFEAIYINDGSKDKTFDVMNKALQLKETVEKIQHKFFENVKAVYRSIKYENIFVIDKTRGGKSECLNAGMAMAKGCIVVTLDADSVLEKNSLKYINQIFKDKNVVAAGGAIHVLQGYDPLYLQNSYDKKKDRLVTLQILDYLKGFYIYKLSLSKQKAIAIISGAFGVFKRDILFLAGGFRKTLGEDIDITLRIQKLIYKTKQKITYLPEALCFTRCPENWSELIRQRIRWQKGFIDCMLYHKWFILKTFLYKSLTFHFLIEALVVGLSSCIFTLFTFFLVFIVAFGNAEIVFIFLIYLAVRLAVSAMYSICSIIISQRYNRYPKEAVKKAFLAIFLDIAVFRLFNLMIYLAGTAVYSWYRAEEHGWNKAARNEDSNNSS